MNAGVLYWIGQAVGVLAMIESFFIYQTSSRKRMVALKLVDDVLWVTHFVLIGGYNAAATTGVAVVREIVFYFKADKGRSNGVFLPISTWVFWIDDEKKAKLIQLPSACCMLVYDVVVASYSGTLTQFVTVASIAVYFIRLRISNRTEKR